MEIRIGDYIRTYDGFIGKVEFIDPIRIGYNHYHFENSFEERYDIDIKLVKEKPIDLIEVGDYVNGKEVFTLIDEQEPKLVATEDGCLNNKDIKSIVTKEQFESIECKVV